MVTRRLAGCPDVMQMRWCRQAWFSRRPS